MDEQLIGLSILALLSIIMMTALLWLVAQHRRLRQSGQAFQLELAALQRDLHALCIGASGVSGHMNRLHQQVTRMSERQERFESRHDSREYDDAVRLARGGSNVEQLVVKCGLGRAEAELLVGLYGACERAA